MVNIFESQFSWWDFLGIATLLIVLYFLLHFIENLLSKFSFFGKYQKIIKDSTSYFLIIYEPLVLLILGCVFVLINPRFHGIFILVVVIASFQQFRNYFSGRIILLSGYISEGRRMETADSKGIIYSLGRLGLRLKTSKGIQFINYSNLISSNYILLSGDEIGGFYNLNIQPIDPKEKIDYFLKLTDLLNSAPYLDWDHKPQIFPIKDISKTMEARVVVKEESHLRDLIALLKESGFNCRVIS